MKTCKSCHKVLEPVYLRADESPETYEGWQYDNALEIKFIGGYGMFIDPMEEQGQYHVLVCHDCAHNLCAMIPWIADLLRPYESHAHNYDQDWTGHTGWDLPHEKS